MDIADLVIDDMRERKKLGLQRYGKTLTLETLDGRDPLREAFEEVLDEAVYLRVAIAERDALLAKLSEMQTELNKAQHLNLRLAEQLMICSQLLTRAAEREARR